MKWGAVTGGVLAALGSLALGSLSLSVSVPAQAADLTPIGQRAIPATSGYIPAQFFWTGFYMGAGIGGGFGTATLVDPLATASASPSLQGFLVTGIAGINFQMSSVVLGVEGDFTGSWAKGSAPDTAGDTLMTSVFWTATATGRVGWAIDRLLIYGKGGAAFDYDRNTVTTTSGTSALATINHVGWTVGGGLEYAVTEHWTGRIEYDYLTFAAKGLFFQGNTTPPPAGGSVSVKLNELKGIMAYKF